jgi:hypothetical protein
MSRSRVALVVLIALLAAIGVWLALRPTSLAPSFARDPATPAGDVRAEIVELDEPIASPRSSVSELAPSAAPPASSATPAPDATSSLLLYGFVRPPDNGALDAETGISLIDCFGRREQARAGFDGAYSFSGLQRGRYSVSAGSYSEGEARAHVDLDGSVAETRLDLKLARLPELLIKVVDREGKPIQQRGLVAVVTREPPGEWFDEVADRANSASGVGRFVRQGPTSRELDDACLGRILLDVAPPVCVSVLHYQRVVATQRVEVGAAEVTFVLDSDSLGRGSLRFRFVDAEMRAPIPRAAVMINGSGSRIARPEGNGFFSGKLDPGWYEIHVTVPGYEHLNRRVRAEAGVDSDLGDLELNRELWISGSIVDEEGRGVSRDLACDPYDPENPARAKRVIMVTPCEKDGTFRIGGLSRGKYLVRMLGDAGTWAESSRIIDTTSGPVENVRIQLVRGVPLAVRASDLDRWRGVSFTIFDAAGEHVLSSRLWSPEPRQILLAPGTYTFEVRTEGSSEPKRVNVTIGTQPVELALP